MAKLVFGVCGIGIGHAMRIKVLIENLQKRHDILIVASQFPYLYLKKYFKDKVLATEGVEIVFKGNAIVNYKTLLRNIKKISYKSYVNIKEIRGKIEKFDPDLIFSDMETVVALIAKDMNKPLVSIGNQHFGIYGDYKIDPKRYIDYLAAITVIKTLVPFPNYSIITFFENSRLKENKKIYLVPPIIRNEILRAKPMKKDYVFVYQSITSYNKLISMLEKINENFIIYGYNINKKRGNLTFKKFDDSKKFIEDLKNCKAVISNAGFTLLSEALILNKPILALPIKKHFEQMLNAMYIQDNSYGEFHLNLNVNNIKKFLQNLNKFKVYKTKLKDNNEVVDVVERLIKNVT